MAGAPREQPAALAVRVAAGKAYRATSTTEPKDSARQASWTYQLSSTDTLATPGFGVLVVDRETGKVAGVMVFTGPPVENAPEFGNLIQGAHQFPLVGLRIDLKKISANTCPLFPDSLGA